ncbi:uncharacterized protein CFP56_038318 [Quercus suber]|uniref:Uncharacterized protein ycf23 n=1 Tax=Quercus suber TaxID=58331 RepID=A0AAW0LMF6_QUESU
MTHGLQNFNRDNVASVVTTAEKNLNFNLLLYPISICLHGPPQLIIHLIMLSNMHGGATHVDIACDPDIVKLAINLTSLPANSKDVSLLQVCVSSVDPAAFQAVVEAGALMVEIGNYDSFYEMGLVFTAEQNSYSSFGFLLLKKVVTILNIAKETKSILPSVTLSVTVSHTLSLPDQGGRKQAPNKD